WSRFVAVSCKEARQASGDAPRANRVRIGRPARIGCPAGGISANAGSSWTEPDDRKVSIQGPAVGKMSGAFAKTTALPIRVRGRSAQRGGSSGAVGSNTDRCQPTAEQ